MKVQLNIRIDEEIKKALEKDAEKKRRSLNNLISLIFEDYLDRENPYISVEGGGSIAPPMMLFNKDDCRTYPYREKCKTCPHHNTSKCVIYGSNPFSDEPMKCTLELEKEKDKCQEKS